MRTEQDWFKSRLMSLWQAHKLHKEQAQGSGPCGRPRSECRKPAKKWPGHFSMKFSNQGYKPGLLAQAQGTKIRHKEVKTSSKSKPRLSLGPLGNDWHFYLGKLELSYHNKIVELWALPTSSGTQMELLELKTWPKTLVLSFFKASLNFSTFWQQEIF